MYIFAKSLLGMQFKYPELLWALLLLLIPIFIHLFQLRRFKKTPFTNVFFLQKVQAESRRSNTLKKWLLLFSRLALLTALIVAFAQPYFAANSAFKKKDIVLFLDNSFSNQAKVDNVSLLENSVQELIKSIPPKETFTLFTNESVYRNVTIVDIQKELLALPGTSKQLKLNEILLKANSLFTDDTTREKDLILISDFQQRIASDEIDSTLNVRKYLIPLASNKIENIAIDSMYLGDIGLENIDLVARLSTNTKIESTPVSLFDNDRLIAKTAALFTANRTAEVHFTLPIEQIIQGKIEISDTGLGYDNQLYFNIDEKMKIKVLAIGSANAEYLSKIYPKDEFAFTNWSLPKLNYGALEEQNLIILNEIEEIPNALTIGLKSFTDTGGSLVVIPAYDLNLESYNRLLNPLMATSLIGSMIEERKITDISFSNPLYSNVFKERITNFQYPVVDQYYRIRTSQPYILRFQDGEPFLLGSDKRYLFTASISNENSNFKNSPLIVPTFYNIGSNSLKLPPFYLTIGGTNEIDIPIPLTKDHILKVSKEGYEFIPQQKSMAKMVTLTLGDQDLTPGIYKVTNNGAVVLHVSLNFNRDESDLRYIDLSLIKGFSKQNSVSALFEAMQNDNAIKELWKWFVILALLFLIIEIFIQKYL
ncbi:MAG: BatA domain-containing protein [Maribacter sp.]|nr:BatA domain-containing protein [Maribacter sp.]